MQIPDDWHLLEEYAATGSHAAFEQLVKRHAGWIYAAALRRVGSADTADDVTQAAFIVLARKASSIGRRESLAAWLYRVVRYTAIDALRRQGNRRRHERLAAKSEVTVTFEDTQDVIENLDVALDDLGARDREAIILHYFNDRTLQEIGDTQKVAASTVQRRLERSLARIASQLRRKGIVAAPSALGGTLSAIGTIVAPPSATHGLTVLATAAGALPATTAGPIGLAHGAMKTMTLMKIKIAAASVAAFVLLGTGGAIATHYAMAQAGNRLVADHSRIAMPATQFAAAPIAAPALSASSDFARQFRVEWQTIDLQITNVNPVSAAAKDGRLSAQSLQIEAIINVLDTSHLLGFDRMGDFVATRILDEAGNDITASAAEPPGDTPWYAPLQYSTEFDVGVQREVLAPQPLLIRLKAAPQLPSKLQTVEGYISALTFDHRAQVDVPFVANAAPVEVLPDVSVHFDSVRQEGNNYSYQMAADVKKRGGLFGVGATPAPVFNGQLRPGQSLPQKMIMETYWVDAKGNRIPGQSHMMGSFPTVGAGNGSGGMPGPEKIAAMRFEIAVDLAQQKLPIRFTDIDVPHIHDGNPNR